MIGELLDQVKRMQAQIDLLKAQYQEAHDEAVRLQGTAEYYRKLREADLAAQDGDHEEA